jgi:hypothetical protein
MDEETILKLLQQVKRKYPDVYRHIIGILKSILAV